MTYSEPNYFPAENQPRRYGYQPIRRGTDGFAVAAFVISFLPGLLAFILVIVFATRALGRIRYSGDKGRGLAIASFWITGFINVLAVILAVALSIPNAADERYVASVDSDMSATVSEVRSAMQTNPSLTSASITPISHDGNVITIQNPTPGTWSVRGYSTQYGDPESDFEDWSSVGCGCIVLHGSYQRFYSYLQAHDNDPAPASIQ